MLQIVGPHGVDTAFALNGFKKDGSHIITPGRGLLERLDVVERHTDKAFHQRLEALLHLGVGRGRKGGNAAAVKSLLAHHDLRAGNALAVAEFARKFERSLVRLQPAVAEKNVAQTRELHQLRGQLFLQRHVKVVAAMNELGDLILQGRHQFRVLVPQGVNGDAAQRIQIRLAIHIPHAATFAVRQGNGQAVVGIHDVGRSGQHGSGRCRMGGHGGAVRKCGVKVT